MSDTPPLHQERPAPYAPPVVRNRVWATLLGLILLWPLSCDQLSDQPLTGHRDIAVALRSLLDLAYTGPDYPTYHAELQSFVMHVQEKIEATPHAMRPYVSTIMAYLRTADEVLQWQAQQSEDHRSPPEDHRSPPEDHRPPQLATWTGRYPFLKAAIGARFEAPGVFDVETAVQLLFEKTDQTLVAMQIKNKPI